MSQTFTPGETQTEETVPFRAEDAIEAYNATPVDVFPDFAISLEEAVRRVKMLQQYVREHMVDGEDYGIIPGSNKPTLFKAGAEKLNAIFGLAPVVNIENRVENWDKGFVSYEIKVTLINKRTGQIEAEGVGSCNSKERRYARQDAPSIANTVLKMAKKRALVDATISATRASGLFTEDLEDMDDSAARGGAAAHSQRPESAHEGHGGGYREEENSHPAPSRNGGSRNWSGGGDSYLTDAQHRAIIAIAGRVFGRPATAEDFAQLTDKPIEELSKSEASSLIDRLRSRQAEQHNGSPHEAWEGRGGRENFNRATNRGGLNRESGSSTAVDPFIRR